MQRDRLYNGDCAKVKGIMDYPNRLKGSVTQSLVRALLSDAGLSVVPLGIEEVIREMADLDAQRYADLGLPMQLRKMPDFFAANADRSKSWLIEVKFRRTWNDQTRDELLETLAEQLKCWSPIHLILFWGETPSHFPGQPSSWIKAAKLVWEEGELWIHKTDGGKTRWRECSWKDLDRIQDVFPSLNSRGAWNAAVLDLTIQVSRGLVAIQGDH
jgi:hypothetical protein